MHVPSCPKLLGNEASAEIRQRPYRIRDHIQRSAHVQPVDQCSSTPASITREARFETHLPATESGTLELESKPTSEHRQLGQQGDDAGSILLPIGLRIVRHGKSVYFILCSCW